jgi:hypothetical protein
MVQKSNEAQDGWQVDGASPSAPLTRGPAELERTKDAFAVHRARQR